MTISLSLKTCPYLSPSPPQSFHKKVRLVLPRWSFRKKVRDWYICMIQQRLPLLYFYLFFKPLSKFLSYMFHLLYRQNNCFTQNFCVFVFHINKAICQIFFSFFVYVFLFLIFEKIQYFTSYNSVEVQTILLSHKENKQQ